MFLNSNLAKSIVKPAAWLTVTKVVFECRGREIGGAFGYRLTVTKVVFELQYLDEIDEMAKWLTVTKVVFEYGFTICSSII